MRVTLLAIFAFIAKKHHDLFVTVVTGCYLKGVRKPMHNNEFIKFKINDTQN